MLAMPFRASPILEAGQGQDDCATESPDGNTQRILRNAASAMTRSASQLEALAHYIISSAALTAQFSARAGVLELLVAISAFEWVAVRNNPGASCQKRAVALLSWCLSLTTFGYYQFRKRRLGQLSLLAILLLALCIIAVGVSGTPNNLDLDAVVGLWMPPALSVSTFAIVCVPIVLEYLARLSEGLGIGLRAWNGMAPL